MFDAKDIGAVVAADPREVAAEYVCIGSRTAAADSAPGAAQPPCGCVSHLKLYDCTRTSLGSKFTNTGDHP